MPPLRQVVGRASLTVRSRPRTRGHRSAFDLSLHASTVMSATSPDHPIPSTSSPQEEASGGWDRRAFLATLSTLGVGGGLFPGILWAQVAEEPEITEENIEAAERLSGLSFTPEQRTMMLENLQTNRGAYRRMREVTLGYDTPPALYFDPLPPGAEVPTGASLMRPSRPTDLPDVADPVEMAYASLTQLGALLRSGRISSEELTRIYLDRLRRYGDELECIVTLTEDLALEQAQRADRELASGHVRGPLHGIPWGAKDLLSTRGYPTTWGAMPFQDQEFGHDATVVRRLEDAGAVLVAKLTLGALAMGDVWFGGQTRSPWDLERGSSGSSAGSAAAVAAGLVGFSIGSETLGSIISPAVRCGATGLRPTFGRVSRAGAMPLSWSMDKLGPLCRTAEDCALILHAIQGPDNVDRTVRTAPFSWDGEGGLGGIRIGYLSGAFPAENGTPELDQAVLRVLEGLGADLVEVHLPDDLPLGALRIILNAEAAASFDDLTRSGRDELLVRQEPGSWPNLFRSARMIPAVEYLQANRLRTRLVGQLDQAWKGVDVVVAPPFAGSLLLATNLSGHPAVVARHGFEDPRTPSAITFIGGLWKDAEALAVAHAFQNSTTHHLERPPRFS